MQECRGETFEETVGVGEVFVRFARESDDHVDTEEYVRHGAAHRSDPVGELRRVVPAAHQRQDAVASALDRNVKMRLESFRSRCESDDLVGQQVRLDRRNAVAIDAFDPVEGPQQVDERFAGRSAEIAGVDTCQYDFALTLRGDSLRFGREIGNREVAAGAARQRNRAVAAMVIAPILYFQERAGAVAGRERGEKVRQLAGFAGVYRCFAFGAECGYPFVDRAFVVVADHQVDPVDGGQILRP